MKFKSLCAAASLVALCTSACMTYVYLTTSPRGAAQGGQDAGPGDPEPPPMGTTYYVDSIAGSDSNSGLAFLSAKKTLAAGVALLSDPGDTLRVNGTFSEQLVVTNKTGSASHPIVIKAHSGRPVINGSGVTLTSGSGLVFTQNLKYVTFDGLEVANSSGYGWQNYRYEPNYPTSITWPSSTGIVVKNCYIHDSQDGGLLFEYTKAPIAYNNYISNTNLIDGNDEAISFRGCEDFVAYNNTLIACGEEGIDAKDGSFNGAIYKNYLQDCGAIGIYLNHARNVRVHTNVVINCGDAGYGQRSGIAMAIGDGALYLTYDVGGYKNRDHADVVAALAAGTAVEIQTAASGTLETSHNLIDHNFVGWSGYTGLGIVVPAVAGSMTNNYFANNILFKNGYYTAGVDYGYGVLFQPGSAPYDTVFQGNYFANNLTERNVTGGWAPPVGNTLTNNVAFAETGSNTFDTTLAEAWGYTAAAAAAEKAAIDTLSALHSGIGDLSLEGDGSFDWTNIVLASSLLTAGVTVSATKHDGSSWGSIDDAAIGVNGTHFTGIGSSVVP